ncbi:MAG: 3-keto-disaccharide hydrolase [Verrucomicrobiia bacterium]
MNTMVQLGKMPVYLIIIALFAFAGCSGKTARTCCPRPIESLSGVKQETSKPQPEKPSAPVEQKTTKESASDWEPLFDGRSLYGWQIIDYAGKGEVTVKDGQIILGMGYMTGIKWTNDPPKMNYEVEYEAMRVDGSDFFGSLTFLVNTNPCTFILGGWGGGTVGISSLNDMDASENETSKFMNFENGKWYKIRIRVTEKKIEAWINEEKLIDVVHTDKKVSLRPGDIEQSAPFGFSTWSTTGALRNIRIRYLK